MSKPVVLQADYDPWTMKPRSSYAENVETVRGTLERGYPYIDNLDQTAGRIARLAEAERSYRIKHDGINHRLVRAVRMGLALDEASASQPARILVAMHDFIHGDEDSDATHRALAQKGLSLSLEHVEQLGDWVKVRELDDIFRALPSSPYLHDRGFVFSDTYGNKEEARLNYGLKMSRSNNGVSLMATRKRAAADVINKNTKYEIVKRSTFFIEPMKLTPQQLKLADYMLQARHGDGVAADEVEQEFGAIVIEPAVQNEADYRDAATVLPVSSTYFTLNRFD